MADAGRFDLRGRLLAALSDLPECAGREDAQVIWGVLCELQAIHREFTSIPFVTGEPGEVEEHNRLSDLIIRVMRLVQDMWDLILLPVDFDGRLLCDELRATLESLCESAKGKTGVGMLLAKFIRDETKNLKESP